MDDLNDRFPNISESIAGLGELSFNLRRMTRASASCNESLILPVTLIWEAESPLWRVTGSN